MNHDPNPSTPKQPHAPYLDDATFRSAVEETPGLAMIDFTASWCGPCRAMAPHVDALSDELQGQVVIAKVDVDANPELASRYGVQAFPTLLFFRDGRVVERAVGYASKHQLKARIDAVRATGTRAA